jgi:serpin B
MKMWLAALALLVAASGCGESGPPGGVAGEQSLRGGNSDFAFALYGEVRDEPGNIALCPLSVSRCMALIYLGARGQTEADMASALRFRLPQPELHEAFAALDAELASRGVGVQDFTLEIVNGAWGATDWSFLQSYVDSLAGYYGVGFQRLSFASDPEGSRQAINQWVSDRTGGRIPEAVRPGQINPLLTKLVVANTVYFKAPWLVGFWVGSDGDFYLPDGSTVTVPIMFTEFGSVPYARGPDWRAVELPFEGEELSMLVVLPDPGEFTSFEATLDLEGLDGVLDSIEDSWVVVAMPRFTIRWGGGIDQVVKDLGMASAYESSADFSGIDGTGGLALDFVNHDVYLAVDENGVEATAATVGGMTAGMAEHFDATRPFMFFILDRQTRSVLFMGRVVDPSAS